MAAPGGGLEHDEDISSGLSREASEELNAEITSFTAGLAPEDFAFGESVTEIEYKEISTLKADMFEPYIRPYFQELLDALKQEGAPYAHTQN